MKGSTRRAVDYFNKPKKQIESSIRTELTDARVEPVDKTTNRAEATIQSEPRSNRRTMPPKQGRRRFSVSKSRAGLIPRTCLTPTISWPEVEQSIIAAPQPPMCQSYPDLIQSETMSIDRVKGGRFPIQSRQR
jgi:hypothetical protein